MSWFKRGPRPEVALLEQARASLVLKDRELVEAKTARIMMSTELRDAREQAARARAKLEDLAERLIASQSAQARAEGRLAVVEQNNADLVTTNKKLMDKCFVGMGFAPMWEVRVPTAAPSPEPGGVGTPINLSPNARDFTAEIQRMEDAANLKDKLEIRQAIIRNMDTEVKEATANGTGK